VRAGDVRSHLRKLRSFTKQRGAVIACEQAADAATDAHFERAEQRLRQRAGPGPRRRRVSPEPAQRRHATFGLARSVFGTGTVATTRSRMASADMSSASA